MKKPCSALGGSVLCSRCTEISKNLVASLSSGRQKGAMKQVLGATVQNLVGRSTWRAGFLPPCLVTHRCAYVPPANGHQRHTAETVTFQSTAGQIFFILFQQQCPHYRRGRETVRSQRDALRFRQNIIFPTVSGSRA